MDSTHILVQGAYLYLCASVDLYSGYVVGWSLSNTITSNCCREIFQEAIEKHGKPEILNTDQGSQFTAYELCDWVTDLSRAIQLSMNGKGRAISHMFTEPLWRSAKYEPV